MIRLFRLKSALAMCIAVAMLNSGLACSSQSAKSSSEVAQASSSPGTNSADTPAGPATPPSTTDKATAKPVDTSQMLPGGKIDSSVKDPGVVEAANFACTAEQDALKAKGQPQAITLVEITAAKSQVVEGVSYDLTLHMKLDGQDQTAEAVVWVRPWLKGDDKIKLTSWKFADKK